MEKALRILIVEDDASDAELLLRMLRKSGYQPIFERVETAESMKEALGRGRWDIIVADYRLPQFSAPEALALLKESHLDIPFIVVSGGIGEATAVAVMKAGAHDYLMKDNLARLIPVIEREMREAANRAGRRRTADALRESEVRYRALWETASDAILLMDRTGTIHFVNPAVEQVFGYRPEELIGQSFRILQPEYVRSDGREALSRQLEVGGRFRWRTSEMPALRKNGSEIPVEVTLNEMKTEGTLWFVSFIRDISERKTTEKALQENLEQFRVAREIQQHLFPASPPDFPGFDIAGTSRPAGAMGGDYFDYLPMMDDRLGLVAGDVTGHGVGPALLMAEVRTCLRLLATSSNKLGEILTRANGVLARDVGTERFVTLLLAQLDAKGKTLSYINAGHPAGYIFGPSGEIRTILKRTGLPLGIRPHTTYSAGPPVSLASGEIVLLLTDGFEEAVDADERVFGLERVFSVVRENRSRRAGEIVQALCEAVHGFLRRAPQTDDFTVVVAKVE